VAELRNWVVAGGLIEGQGGLLLVKNQRRTGACDWSPPGGVIDATDGSLLEGLTREVEEETGLRVQAWDGPVYEVRADALGLGWSMRCEVYVARGYEGELRVEDPDGIVVDAAFVPWPDCDDLLIECHPWVREPLAAWIADRWTDRRGFHYELHGDAIGTIEIIRR
jgi:8-oxo-dGTP pyrophosphatase MutT (NUDIX family)